MKTMRNPSGYREYLALQIFRKINSMWLNNTYNKRLVEGMNNETQYMTRGLRTVHKLLLIGGKIIKCNGI